MIFEDDTATSEDSAADEERKREEGNEKDRKIRAARLVHSFCCVWLVMVWEVFKRGGLGLVGVFVVDFDSI